MGPHGVPNVEAGFELLKPGGWYLQAGWEQARYETPPTEWAIQGGHRSAEYHVWQHWREQTEQERVAVRIEHERLASLGCESAKRTGEQTLELRGCHGRGGNVMRMTHESLLIAQKPDGRPGGRVRRQDPE